MSQDFDWNGIRVHHAPGLAPLDVEFVPDQLEVRLGAALAWVNSEPPALFNVLTQQLVDLDPGDLWDLGRMVAEAQARQPPPEETVPDGDPEVEAMFAYFDYWSSKNQD